MVVPNVGHEGLENKAKVAAAINRQVNNVFTGVRSIVFKAINFRMFSSFPKL